MFLQISNALKFIRIFLHIFSILLFFKFHKKETYKVTLLLNVKGKEPEGAAYIIATDDKLYT